MAGREGGKWVEAAKTQLEGRRIGFWILKDPRKSGKVPGEGRLMPETTCKVDSKTELKG